MIHTTLVDEARGTEYALGPEARIGRGRHCEIRLDDKNAERQNAVITHFSSGYAIRPHGKKSTVLVNDEEVTDQRQLAEGDRVRIGLTTLVVSSGAPFGPPVDEGAHRGAVPPPPVARPPAVVEAAASAPVPDTPPRFAAGRSRRRAGRPRSAARRNGATLICIAIVFADAIAVCLYLTGN